MSNYDDALSLIENEVNRDCEYYVYSQLRDCIDTIEDDCKLLESENAKLRKLLLDVWNDAMQFDGFWDYVNDDGEIYNEDELPHYYDRMRKLGLEVR